MKIDDIKTKEDLSEFIKVLMNEYNKDDWENNNIPDFLEAMSAWIIDMDGYYKNNGKDIPNKPDWKTFAEILKASTMYE